MPTETFRHTVHTDVPPATVWEALDEEETWSKIPGVDRILSAERDASGDLQAFNFEANVGGRAYVGRATIAERSAPERILWRIQTPDLGGTVGVDIQPEGDGTLLAVEVMVQVDGFLAAMFFPVITAALGRGFGEAVEDFAASFTA
ncbi:MAG: SRPBCC family protein [Acidimicrobiales bacterium]|nr:SRPBCC family protein [Acidimicrobiales bacterium]